MIAYFYQFSNFVNVLCLGNIVLLFLTFCCLLCSQKMYANKNIKLGIKIGNKINISKFFFFEKYQDDKHHSISSCCFPKMYLLLLMLFTNEKWINLSHVLMLDLQIIARYVRFGRERKEFDGKRRRIRELEERSRKKGGRFGKTGKSGQPTQ